MMSPMNPAMLVLAAVESTGSPVADSLQLAATGVLLVFISLITIKVLLDVLDRLTRPAPEKPPAASSATDSLAKLPKANGKGAAQASNANEIPEEILAVISAAVVAALGPTARITKIRLSGPTSESAWAELGRRDHHVSHRLRKKDP